MPDANGNLIPGDPTPTACTKVGLIVPGLLKDDGGVIARSTAHPEFHGRVWTASFVLGEFRDALKAGGLDICNESEIAAGKTLSLSIKKLPVLAPVTYVTDYSAQSASPFPIVQIVPGCNVVGMIGVDPGFPPFHLPFCKINAMGYAAWRVIKSISTEGGPFVQTIILSGTVSLTTGECLALPASVFDSRVAIGAPTGFLQALVMYHVQLSGDGTTWDALPTSFSPPFPPRNCALGSGGDPCPTHGPGSPWH
jgi:hypothetical protein